MDPLLRMWPKVQAILAPWSKSMFVIAVQKLMATFEPSVNFAKEKYNKLHDMMVVSPSSVLQSTCNAQQALPWGTLRPFSMRFFKPG